ncbi:MAG: phosphodiester glycosidase family protein [Oscillospiraceae bacterium]|nr:phosphodiester glycosidase family protein [Oscillospiraceae bacterium]
MRKMRLLCLLLALCCLLPLAAPAEGAPPEPVVWDYSSDTLTITITEEHRTIGARQPLAFYVADVRIQKPEQLRAAFAKDVYHTTYREDTESIAERYGAILAINGDYYNHDDKLGIILRNGQLYRDRASSRDLMYIDAQGGMHVMLKDARGKGTATLTGESLLAEGAVQSYEFGPALIDNGQALPLPEKYFIYTDDSVREPRTAIGMVEPLHYIVVVADGRRKNWSEKGMKFSEMQEIFLEHGCQVAYNLDGGGSTTLYFYDRVLNHPAGGGQRQVSDILYFAD